MSMREEFAIFVVEHLGPHALTGGTMSIYEATEKAWKAAYLAGAKAMQEEAKKRCEEVSNTAHDQRMIAAIDCAEAVSAINPENLGD